MSEDQVVDAASGSDRPASRALYTTTRRSARAARRAGRSAAAKWRRRIVGGLAAALVAVPAAGGAGWWYLNYRLDQAHRITLSKGLLHESAPGAPFNVLLIGSDSRQFESSGSQAGKFGSASVVSGQRSDVLIIARVVPASHQVYLLSIPRDLYVDIPGDVPDISGMNRINSAFNTGPSLLIETLRKDLGISVEHYAAINFAGFQSMVQAVGGIRIDFPDRIEDPYTGLSIQHTGCQLISGGMALAYVRSRHLSYYADGQWNYDGMSDWSRIRRQDVFFRALLHRVKDELANPLAMNGLLGATVHNLTLDSTFTNSELISLGLAFRHVSEGSIHSEVLPTVPYVNSYGDDVLLPAWSDDRAMIRAFLAIGTSPSHAAAGHAAASGAHAATTGSTTAGATTTTLPATTTTTTTPSADIVFDTQPEPWNGTPC